MSGNFNYRFSSEYLDIETGLVYYILRYYTPELGKWLSKDPIEEKGGVNLYAMVGNNAITRRDRLGLAFADYLPLSTSWSDVANLDNKTAKTMFCLLNKLGYNITDPTLNNLWQTYLNGGIHTGTPLNTYTGEVQDDVMGEAGLNPFFDDIYINEILTNNPDLDPNTLKALISTAMHEARHIHLPVVGPAQDWPLGTTKALEAEVDGKVDSAVSQTYTTLCCCHPDGSKTTQTINLWQHYINQCSGKKDECSKK